MYPAKFLIRLTVGATISLFAIYIYFGIENQHNALLYKGSAITGKKNFVVGERETRLSSVPNLFYNYTHKNTDIEVNGHEIFFHKPFEKKNSKRIRVHFVFHSHVDPGWLKTFENYYQEDTKHILDSAIGALKKYPGMRFIWSEISFLERWWRDATEEQKMLTKRFILSGRLEISGGAWVMTDEATPLFYSAIENLVEGHQFLHKEFGLTPNTSWSVDPFGHGAMMPLLLPLAGVDYMVIGRFHNHVKEEMRKRQTLRWKWEDKFIDSKSPLVNSLPFLVYTTEDSCPNLQLCKCYHVGPSNRFSCTKRPPLTKIGTAGNDVKGYVEPLLEQYRQVQELFGSEDVLAAIGDDFFFKSPEDFKQMFEGFDMMRKYVEAHPELNAEFRFSTVSEFFDHIKENDLPTLQGDLFPYTGNAKNPQPWWTGYFVHRPHSKRIERALQTSIRTLDLIRVLKKDSKYFQQLQQSKRDLALFQHHDGITGTSKIHVMRDYENRMIRAIGNVTFTLATLTNEYLNTNGTKSLTTLPGEHVHFKIEETSQLSLFNPSTRTQTKLVSFYTDHSVAVQDLQVQNDQIDNYWKVTMLLDLAPLSFHSISLKKGVASKEKALNNRFLYDDNGLLRAFALAEGYFFDLKISFWVVNDKGAAYVFWPTGVENLIQVKNMTADSGPLVVTKLFVYNDIELTMKISHWSEDGVIDVDVTSQVPRDRTVIMKIGTKLNNSRTFYTDVNGLYHIRRHYVERALGMPTPWEANIFPVASSGFIQDKDWRLTLITGQSTGMTSRSDGEMEILVDRVTTGDDGKGLGYGEAIDERLNHLHYRFLIERRMNVNDAFDESPTLSARGKLQWEQVLYPPELLHTQKSEKEKKDEEVADWPCDLDLVTWRPLENGKRLLVLRRYAFDPTIPAVACEATTMEELFGWLSSQGQMIHSSLTGTTDGEAVTADSFVKVLQKPLAIASFITNQA